ncbi:MAG: pyridoxamine 5'-phosphate oxidase family protein [Promethearchaeota archaeon]
MKDVPNFAFIEAKIRTKDFGFITTIDSKCRPHTTGILYGVAPAGSPFEIYILTGRKYVKARHMQENPAVSLAIPFPHHLLRFVPARAIQFRGTAEMVSLDDPVAREAFQASRILRMNIESEYEGEMVFFKITPARKVFVYGLGYSLAEMKKNHAAGSYTIVVPEDRRS